MFTLVVETIGNPDFAQDHTRPLPCDPGFSCTVASEDEAVTVFGRWRDRSSVGCGNLARADLLQGDALIARISCNGRIWPE